MNPNLKAIGTITVDVSTVPLPLLAWTQILALVPKAATAIELFNSSGASLALSQGVPGQEAAGLLPYTILQGGSSKLIALEIASGKPLSMMALDNAGDSGTVVLNLFG